MLRLWGVLFLLLSTLSIAQESTTVKTPRELKNEMQAILDAHVSSHAMTPRIALEAHKKFFELFDPEGIYLFQNEVDAWVYQKRCGEYFTEWKSGSVRSFEEMVGVIQIAIRRAQGIRSLLQQQQPKFSEFMVLSRSVPQQQTSTRWPSSFADLAARQKKFFAERVLDECSSFAIEDENVDEVLHRGMRAVEAQLEKKEDEWLRAPCQDTKYVDPYLADRIMKAYTKSLDAHSDFFDANEAEKLEERLSKKVYGTGLCCTIRDGKELVIQKILPLSPAASVTPPLEKGDVIVAMNGTSVCDLIENGQDVQQMLGDGTEVSSLSCEVITDSKETRRQVFLQKRSFVSSDGRLALSKVSLSGGDVYVLSMDAFYDAQDGQVSSEYDMRRTFSDIKARAEQEGRKPLGVILDLRENRGGYLLQAVHVAGLFIRTGVIVIAKYSDGKEVRFRDLDQGEIYEGPMIVLISKMTASAAEIVTSALKDYGVALVVGDSSTYGKGSIQTQTATSHEEGIAQFKVTVGQYYSVLGNSIQGRGVLADVVVPGIYYRQKVGEHYLSSVLPTGKNLGSAAQDNLQDVAPGENAWMQRFYAPFIQKPSDRLRKYVKQLRQKSHERMAKDPIWNAFLKGDGATFLRLVGLQGASEAALEQKIKTMQLDEAVQILKDLASLSAEKAELIPFPSGENHS